MRNGNRTARRRAVAVGAALVLAVAVAAVNVAVTRQSAQPQLTVAGVAQDPCQQQRALPVPAQLSGQFEPDSSILHTAAGVYMAPGKPALLTPTATGCGLGSSPVPPRRSGPWPPGHCST